MDVFSHKRINIGIQIIRMICCFLVIVTHFYGFYHFRFLKGMHGYYLSMFFFISFYFNYNTLISKNIIKIKERLKRMIIPYVGWPIILYLKDKSNHYLLNKKEKYNNKNLYYQLLIGYGIYGIFWFLFNLIFISLFFILTIFIFKKKSLLVLLFICIVLYTINYSNIVSFLFIKFKFYPVHHSIKPIFVYFPFAYTGFIFYSIKPLNKLYKYHHLVINLLMIIIFYFLHYYKFIFSIIPFFSIGIIRLLFIIKIFLLFALFPFHKIKNYTFINLMNKISSYTGGVFYLHVEMETILSEYFYSIRKKTIRGCLLIYLVSYLICLIGNFVFKNNDIKYLFS